MLLIVNEQQPWKTLEEFIADAKKQPEQIVYSSGGLYGASHLPVALLEKATGLTKMRHLPTTGGGPAITAVLGNNAQFSTQTGQASLQHIKSGKLRALASFGEQRSKSLPDVPTLKEKGIDVVYYLWVGLFAPKGTPAAVPQDALGRGGPGGRERRSSMPRSPISGLSRRYLNAAEFHEILGRGREALRRCRAADRQGAGVRVDKAQSERSRSNSPPHTSEASGGEGSGVGGV